jgi:hypothetical protein
MSRFTRVVMVLTALASSLAAMSSTAEAVTWTNEGATSFHATGIGGARHLPGGINVNFHCTGETATGTAPMHTSTNTIMTGTLTLAPCSHQGLSSSIHCSYTMTGVNFTGSTLGGVTNALVDLTCDERLTTAPGWALCHINGTVPAQYSNPTVAGGTGRLTFHHSTALTQSDLGMGICQGGTAVVTWDDHVLTTTTSDTTPIFFRHS